MCLIWLVVVIDVIADAIIIHVVDIHIGLLIGLAHIRDVLLDLDDILRDDVLVVIENVIFFVDLEILLGVVIV